MSDINDSIVLSKLVTSYPNHMYDRERTELIVEAVRSMSPSVVTPILKKFIVPLLIQGVQGKWKTSDSKIHCYESYREILRIAAAYDFECFLLYMEIDRPPEQQFYQPRKKQLGPVVQDMQNLADPSHSLEVLGVTMPPRVGKSALCTFYLAYRAGRNPHSPILGISYSGPVTTTFYSAVLALLNDDITYRFNEIFPNARVYSTHARDLMVDLAMEHRYKSLSFRSVDSSLTGAVEAEQLLYLDDLVANLEEAQNLARLDKLWDKYMTNIVQRQKSGCQTLIVGTRWAGTDPIGRLQMMYEEEKDKSKFITLPALDPMTDESNFFYEHNQGFSTEDYRKRRENMQRMNNHVEWSTVYQGQPMNKDGALFLTDQFNTFAVTHPHLADSARLQGYEMHESYAAVDVAYGGGDSLAMPIIWEIGDELYLVDVYFSKADKDVTIPEIARRLREYKVKRVQFEANNGGDLFMEMVRDNMNDRTCHFSAKKAPTNKSKVDRIKEYSPEIRTVKLLMPRERSVEYQRYVDELFQFNTIQKNIHDDAPDSLAMAMAFIHGPKLGKTEIIRTGGVRWI